MSVARASMNLLSGALDPQQVVHRSDNPLPCGVTIQIASRHQLISPHRGMNRCLVAVLVDQEFGGALDVALIDHDQRAVDVNIVW